MEHTPRAGTAPKRSADRQRAYLAMGIEVGTAPPRPAAG